MALATKQTAAVGTTPRAAAARPALRRVVTAHAATASQPEAADAPSRRQALAFAAAAAAAIAGAAGAPVAAAAEAACGDLVETPSGLKFCEIAEGAGKEPSKGSLIRCHYTGRLASNGKVFDSSYTRGRPLTFKVRTRWGAARPSPRAAGSGRCGRRVLPRCRLPARPALLPEGCRRRRRGGARGSPRTSPAVALAPGALRPCCRAHSAAGWRGRGDPRVGPRHSRWRRHPSDERGRQAAARHPRRWAAMVMAACTCWLCVR